MPRHVETRDLRWTPEQMFDLVADVARYPEFLPWVSAARVRQDGPDQIIAELVVGFSGFKERFTSRVRTERPHRIVIDYVDGPLKFLDNEWTFSAGKDGGCELRFEVDFAFRSRILEAVASRVFHRAVARMIAAFEARAESLYGAGAGSGISSSRAHKAA
ncbi:MAG TPA: type II toxin-antitoxin system RatA family toxin [Sphingomonadaceae bacterium]|nr:type II toxin-antitoxin system RatA family toxin [Sphingomonadaceae bacterium]